MFFDDYKIHIDSRVNSSLLWEYDLSVFDYQQMRQVVVQRVIERGWKEDWYAMLNLYGKEGVKNTIKELPYLNDKDLNFVRLIFQIPLSEMKCYERRQSQPQHWNS